jgi:hypothetical protein
VPCPASLCVHEGMKESAGSIILSALAHFVKMQKRQGILSARAGSILNDGTGTGIGIGAISSGGSAGNHSSAIQVNRSAVDRPQRRRQPYPYQPTALPVGQLVEQKAVPYQ